MIGKPLTSMLNIAMSLSDTLDLVSPKVVNHHRKVAFIAYMLGVEMNLPLWQRKNLFLAGVFHDIGAFYLKERFHCMNFEINHPHDHAERGYELLQEFEPFKAIADIVRFHHVQWNRGNGAQFKGSAVPIESHIIHLADRISIQIPEQLMVLRQAKGIVETIKQYTDTWFMPELVEAFAGLAEKEHFWLDAASQIPTETLRPIIDMDTVELDAELLQSLTTLFSRVIDYRSRFTVTHSSGVAASAEILARLAGFSQKELLLMRSAGHLHDLGKLVVPAAILEKPGKLDPEEWDVMRSHTYFGFRALQKIADLETVNVWGSLHHERLDGSGYPFHLRGDELPLGSRIMAVADIFTALTEDRPYREGLAPQKAADIVTSMAMDGAIDKNVVELLRSNLLAVNEYRVQMASQAFDKYRNLCSMARYDEDFQPQC